MNNQSNKSFNNAQMVIDGNIIECENNSIQILNISRLWVGPLPREQLPLNLVLLLLTLAIIGSNFINSTYITLSILGCVIIVLIFITSLCINSYYSKNKSVGLHIKLCSGETYSFLSENIDFIIRIYNLMNEIIGKQKSIVDYNISFKGNGLIIDNLASLNANEIIKDNINIKQDNISKQADNSTQKIMDEQKHTENIEEIDTLENVEILKDTENQVDIPHHEIINEALYLELQVLFTSYSQRSDVNEENLLLIGQTARQIKNNDGVGIRESFEKFITLGLINDCNELGLSLLIEQIKVCIF